MILCVECDAVVVAAQAARAEQEAYARIERQMRASGLPRAYRTGERSLGHLPMSASAAINACQMLGENIRGLFLTGDAGAHKTSVAAAFLASQIRAGGSGRYILVPDLFTDLYAIYAGGNGSRAEIVDALIRTPMLVLDDLGKEKASEHAADVLFEVLDGRYREHGRGRWMIVTSNYTVDTLASRFEDEGDAKAIARRLSEMTVAVAMTARAA